MDAFVMKRLVELIEKRIPVAMVTVTSKTGSGPRDTGSMMIVDAEGKLIEGTIGGGGVEEKAKKDAKRCIEKGDSLAFHYELTLKDSEHSLGMACGGMMDVFIKVFKPESSLVIFGGGHIGLKLCTFAKSLDFHVTVVDHREEYASLERFADADKILTGSMDEILKLIPITTNTSVVIVTHGHVFDLEALRAMITTDAGYIGMIGSRNKIHYCFNELIGEGVTQSQLDQIHAPIGLDIGGDTPAEIALAILAEIQAVKYGKSGPFLKDLRKE